MYDASSRKDIRKAEKAAAIIERDRINYLAAAMSTMQGRLWFYDFLEFCNLFNEPFSGIPARDAFNAGKRNVGLRIFADLQAHCPDQYITMMREANGRRTASTTRDPDSPAPAEYSRSPDPGRDAEGSIDPALDPTIWGDPEGAES